VAQRVTKKQRAKQIEPGLELSKEADLEPTVMAAIIAMEMVMISRSSSRSAKRTYCIS
jgi:hypothetical protein